MNNRNNRVTKRLITILIILVIIAGALIVKEVFTEDDAKKLEAMKQDELSQSTVAETEKTQPEETEPEETKPEEPKKQELFEQYYEQAEEKMKEMTLEEKVGQMFLARYPETGVDQEIKELNPGGYILFGRDFENESKASIVKKLSTNQRNSKMHIRHLEVQNSNLHKNCGNKDK